MTGPTNFRDLTAGDFLGIPGDRAGDLYVQLQACASWIANRPSRTTLYFRRPGDPARPPEPKTQFCRCCHLAQPVDGISLHLDWCLVTAARRILRASRVGVPAHGNPEDDRREVLEEVHVTAAGDILDACGDEFDRPVPLKAWTDMCVRLVTWSTTEGQ